MYLQTKCLVSAVFACTTFSLNAQTVIAQPTASEFDIVYDTLFTLKPIKDQAGFFTARISGLSQNSAAAFGLTRFESNTFGKLVSQETAVDGDGNVVPVRQNLAFEANPDILGLESRPGSVVERRIALGIPNPELNSDIYFGDDDSQLFGQASDSAEINFFPPGFPDFPGIVNGSGVITITGGTGRFENARGEIVFEQSDRLPEDPNAPTPGVATLSFTIVPGQEKQDVPEPVSALGLMAVGVAAIVTSQHKRQASLSSGS